MLLLYSGQTPNLNYIGANNFKYMNYSVYIFIFTKRGKNYGVLLNFSKAFFLMNCFMITASISFLGYPRPNGVQLYFSHASNSVLKTSDISSKRKALVLNKNNKLVIIR